jgi:4'-phosphopantetheinyl transferase
MPAASSAPGPDEVRVWLADAAPVSADTALRDRLFRLLLPAERTRFDGYHADADRLMFLLGRAMARTLVGEAIGVAPTAWRWREGPHGRPEIDAPATPVRFNIAHSSGVVACALAHGRDVGVDVEDLERAAFDVRLVRRCCSPLEAADVEARPADRWPARFLRYWTLKEAYLKARGLGISVHLPDISFSLDDTTPRVGFLGSLADSDTRWAFQLQQPTARHLLAVAASTADGTQPHVRVDWWGTA